MSAASRTFAGPVAAPSNPRPRTQVLSAPAPAPAPMQVQVCPSREEIAAMFALLKQEARGGPKPTRPPRAGHHWASVNGVWIERRNPGTVPANERKPTPKSGWIDRKDGTKFLRKQRKQRK